MKRNFFLIVMGIGLIGSAIPGLAQTNVITLDAETRGLIREASKDKSSKWEALLSTLLGAALATGAGVWTTRYSHKLQINQKKREDEEFVANVLRAIRRELEALRGMYDSGIGADLKTAAHEEVFLGKLAITQDLFPVFDSNAVHLGKLHADVAGRIITTYALMKALIEQFRINNGCVDDYFQAEAAVRAREGEQHLKKNLEIIYGRMVLQTARIRKTDSAVQQSSAELLRLFGERGIV